MPDNQYSPPLDPKLAIDIHVDNTWCYVTCIDTEQVGYTCLKRGEWQGVTSVVRAGGDLVEFLEEAVPLGRRVKPVPLCDLQSMDTTVDN